MAPIKALVDGEGPAVILAHGWAASRADWQAQIPALVSAGYRVYALDHLGHGASAKPALPTDYTLANVYTAFCAWLDSLQLAEPFGLVGHSMGGYVSLLYASKHPDRVRALGLLDPLVAPEQMTLSLKLIFSQPSLLEKVVRTTPARGIAALYRFSPHRLLSLTTRMEIARTYKQASPLIAYLLHKFPSVENHLNQITAPTLMIYGEQDLSLQPAMFPLFGCQIPNLVGLHGLANTGHTPHIDQPEVVNRQLLAFLNRYLKRP